jgi:hypothetical protein
VSWLWTPRTDADVSVTPACDGVPMRIDCDECVMRDTRACDDCVVTFLANREPGTAVVFDADEARAVRLMSDAGLVPQLRHRRRAG